jgi:hypothetical protein
MVDTLYVKIIIEKPLETRAFTAEARPPKVPFAGNGTFGGLAFTHDSSSGDPKTSNFLWQIA